MELISYIPLVCQNDTISGCEQLIAYARFDTKTISQEQASLQFYTTIFT